jgi:hypothetical protein
MIVGAPAFLTLSVNLDGTYFQTGQVLQIDVEHPGNFNMTPVGASALYV